MGIQIIRWDDETIKATFTDDWVPIDITWYTIFFTVKKKGLVSVIDPTDSNASIKKDITTHSSPTTWETEIILTNTDTQIDAWVYDADLQLKDTSWKISSVLLFDFEIIQEWTQRTS